MSSLTKIREEIFNGCAKRIIIRVKTQSRISKDCHDTAYKAVSDIFPNWENDSRVLFLSIQVWADRIFMNVDVDHADYDYQTAHQDNTILPVYVLRMYRGNWVLQRWQKEDERVALHLAELHRVNGYGVNIPFFENHNTRIVYDKPRDLPDSNWESI